MRADEVREAFEAKAAAWDAYTETPAGHLREELNWRYLVAHLPPAGQALKILDAGGGTGGLAIRLAQRGHLVHILDLADEMLRIAREKAEAAGVASRITVQRGRVEDVARYWGPESFDGVVCHTLLEYVLEPAVVVAALAGTLRPEGLFSLVFVNRFADTLRLALARGDLIAAREALTATSSPADLFGVPRQTFDADTMRQALEEAAVESIAEYGVRIFADYLSSADWQTDPTVFDALVSLEAAAAPHLPYCRIGRYGQLIGRKKA